MSRGNCDKCLLAIVKGQKQEKWARTGKDYVWEIEGATKGLGAEKNPKQPFRRGGLMARGELVARLAGPQERKRAAFWWNLGWLFR